MSFQWSVMVAVGSTLASQLRLVGVAAMEFQKGHACEEGKNESFAWAWRKIRKDSFAWVGPWTFFVLS
jgi:hypothetical protein